MVPEDRDGASIVHRGDEQLDPDDYRALRAIAARILGSAAGHATLTPTVLLHEGWTRLRGRTRERWNGPAHRKAALVRAMRHVLVDRARSLRAGHGHVSLETSLPGTDAPGPDLEALDRALADLEAEDERCARVVELLFFGGLEQREVAEVLGVSVRTVQGDWAYARSRLLRALDV